MVEEMKELETNYTAIKKDFRQLLNTPSIKEINDVWQVKIALPKNSTKNSSKPFGAEEVAKYTTQLFKFSQECLKKTNPEHAKKLVLKILHQEVINLIIQVQKMIDIKEANIYKKIHIQLLASHNKIEHKVFLVAKNKELLEKNKIERSMPKAFTVLSSDEKKPKFKI